MMLATIPPPPGQQIDIGPLTIHFYGVLIGIGALLAIGVGRRRYAALGGDPDLIDRVGVVAVLAGLVGARMGYITTHLELYAERPWAILFIWEGGLAIFPGLALGFAAGIWYARRLGMPLMPTLDAMVPGIPLAQAFGRWGNYFNQELYGTPTNLPWGLEVQSDFRVAPYEEFSTFHPTFLYESLLNLSLFAILLWVSHRGKLRQGSIVWAYLLGYGFIRFWVELLRTDTPETYFGLTRNNWAALAAFIAGLILLVWWQRRAPDRPVGTPIAQPATAQPTGEQHSVEDSTTASDTLEPGVLAIGAPESSEPEPGIPEDETADTESTDDHTIDGEEVGEADAAETVTAEADAADASDDSAKTNADAGSDDTAKADTPKQEPSSPTRS